MLKQDVISLSSARPEHVVATHLFSHVWLILYSDGRLQRLHPIKGTAIDVKPVSIFRQCETVSFKGTIKPSLEKREILAACFSCAWPVVLPFSSSAPARCNVP